jgi:hypothetical protein
LKIELTETLWLGEHHAFSLQELCELSGCSEPEIRELIEYGVLTPAHPPAHTPTHTQESSMTFSDLHLVAARAARRLSKDLDLDQHAVALMIKLLDRIQELEAQVRDLNARLP